jgi:predicted component of type VI protein secretion system
MQTLTLAWQIQGQPYTYTVSGGRPCVIGRQAGACDILLADPSVSRQHAMIFADGDTFYLRNLSQQNLVRFNAQYRLAFDQRVPLQQGDSFRLGPIELRVTGGPVSRPKALKIQCANCKRTVDYQPEEFCPWCGRALANGQAILVDQ